ncbi:MAG TPA: iron-sulfur cluster assembly scaffold protein [Pyrinomonadaceae bacterium]|jgi:NifU-like protein
MTFYPPKISARFYQPKNSGKSAAANGVGTGASFVCGAFVRFYLEIDAGTKEITQAKFKTGGCGYSIAAADVLAGKIKGKKLIELHGLDELQAEVESELGNFSAFREHCLEICLDALHAAFADFRAYQIEEFAGEKALICTCFGVSEDEIEKAVAENEIETIEEVTKICKAGGGCGSCQFLIQEIIDNYRNERF